MNKTQWLKEVKHEVDTLKRIATQEEISKLNFSLLNPRDFENCIYGQMTGSCESPRAKELMDNACIRLVSGSGISAMTNKTYREIEHNINGEYNDKLTWDSFGDRDYSHLSALEGYIATKGAKNKSIIGYLKGKRNTLNL